MWNHKAADGRDRRANVRYAHALKVSYRPLGTEAAAWSATVQDLSRTGMALVMDRPVRPGGVLVASLDGLGGRFARPLLLRAMNVRQCEDGTWHIGCAFVKPLTDADVQALLLAPPA